jgi:group II intron reverse transcriptase/maturase
MAKGGSLSGVPWQRYPIRGEVLVNIGEVQRKLGLWAEQDAGRKFYGLFDLISDMDWLRLAHDYARQNAGSKTAGCDGVVMADFDEDLEGNLLRLHEALESDKFVACPVRRVNIPKANGKVRPLGIPTIRDRIVQGAVRMALEPIYEADPSQNSFGFRPNRRTMDAIRRLMDYTTERGRYFWVIEGDISAYFDTINHRKLMKLLRRRIDDEKLLDLIWKFLRAGVMERRLFKDTRLGTPQGGIVSPLLANVYLHELDEHMERFNLPHHEREKRRWQDKLANFGYARYADDFVILCNGTKEQALEMRQGVHDFLRDSLRLTLSMEKTKVVHLNDGFDFLGFHLRRSMGHKGMVTKVLISEKVIKRHRETIRIATSPDTHQDSVVTKILALNRIIAGWCRYFQYTSKPGVQFRLLGQETFWRLAHWIGRKFKLNMPDVLHQYRSQDGLGVERVRLTRHDSFTARRYHLSPSKPNPYTTQEAIQREELPDDNPWLGTEARPGMMDLRNLVVERDGFACRICKEAVTYGTAQVDHIRPVSCYKRPVDANRLENLWTLCGRCHKEKTENDRQRESRVR